MVKLHNSFEVFYPTFNRKYLFRVVKSIDISKKGFVSYNDLQNFILRYSMRSSVIICLNSFHYLLNLRKLLVLSIIAHVQQLLIFSNLKE